MLVALACALAACGGDDEMTGSGPTASADTTRSGETLPDPAAEPSPAPCPADAGNCRSASGTILYVEKVDPDGDGDAHFVLASPEGITAQGITVVDVRRGLRPSPLPGVGDKISAAGPVFRGSYGQRQIQADVLNVTR